MKPTNERPGEGNRPYWDAGTIAEMKILHSQPGRKTPKGAGLGWGPGGLDCSDYPERREK